jgi:hypothetical protein
MWNLLLGGEIIVRLQETSIDFPRTYAELVESPAFERFREFFLDEDLWSKTQEFEKLCNEIAQKGGFSLHNTATGEHCTNFRLNHEGHIVWFRYS